MIFLKGIFDIWPWSLWFFSKARFQIIDTIALATIEKQQHMHHRTHFLFHFMYKPTLIVSYSLQSWTNSTWIKALHFTSINSQGWHKTWQWYKWHTNIYFLHVCSRALIVLLVFKGLQWTFPLVFCSNLITILFIIKCYPVDNITHWRADITIRQRHWPTLSSLADWCGAWQD